MGISLNNTDLKNSKEVLLCMPVINIYAVKVIAHTVFSYPRAEKLKININIISQGFVNADLSLNLDVHESTSNQSQQAAKIMSDAEELFDEMGIRSVMSNFMSTMEDSGLL